MNSSFLPELELSEAAVSPQHPGALASFKAFFYTAQLEAMLRTGMSLIYTVPLAISE